MNSAFQGLNRVPSGQLASCYCTMDSRDVEAQRLRRLLWLCSVSFRGIYWYNKLIRGTPWYTEGYISTHIMTCYHLNVVFSGISANPVFEPSCGSTLDTLAHCRATAEPLPARDVCGGDTNYVTFQL